MKWKLSSLTLSLLCLSGLALADGKYGSLQVAETSAGKVLANEKGMTLYTFDDDMPGMSTCTGKCTKVWPPALAPADAKPVGHLTIIPREDGTKQWADHGKPLYTFFQDKKPRDVAGDGMNGVWHVVKEE